MKLRELSAKFARDDGQPLDGYACVGSVRGWCGHVHRTVSGAIDCLEADRRGCSSQDGYSDRAIYDVVDGEIRDDGPKLERSPSGDLESA